MTETTPVPGFERERRWWIASLAFVILIYATLYFVRGPVEYLRENNLLRLAVGAAFATALVWAIVILVRRGVGWMEGLVLLVSSAVFFSAVQMAGLPEEKLHFLEYGLLGAMLLTATRERALRLGKRGSSALWSSALVAAVLASLAGWGDEGIQAVLPNRYYDVRDILWNSLGSGMVIAALVAASMARDFDRRR